MFYALRLLCRHGMRGGCDRASWDWGTTPLLNIVSYFNANWELRRRVIYYAWIQVVLWDKLWYTWKWWGPPLLLCLLFWALQVENVDSDDDGPSCNRRYSIPESCPDHVMLGYVSACDFISIGSNVIPCNTGF